MAFQRSPWQPRGTASGYGRYSHGKSVQLLDYLYQEEDLDEGWSGIWFRQLQVDGLAQDCGKCIGVTAVLCYAINL